jgi:hypothetical protein
MAFAQVRISNHPAYPGYSHLSANSLARRHYRTDVQIYPAVLEFNPEGDSVHLEKVDGIYKTKIPITVTFPGEHGVRIFKVGTVGDITGGGQGRYFRIGGVLPQLEDVPIVGGRRNRSHQRRKRSTRRRRHTSRR